MREIVFKLKNVSSYLRLNIVFIAVRLIETQTVKSLLLLWKLSSWFEAN